MCREYSSQLLNLFGSLMKSSGSFTMFVEKWVSTLKSMDSAGVLNGCPMANIAFNIDTQDRHYSDAFNAMVHHAFRVFQGNAGQGRT
jgi:hypothetical protein